ncbi:MAG: hypothetical protein R3E68_07365 [Burkholderiaceae bacterium]
MRPATARPSGGRSGRRRLLAAIASLGLPARIVPAGAGLLAGRHGGLAAAQARRTRFALICDTSYDETEAADLPAVIAAAGRGSEFILHLGDIKSGIEICDDETLARRLAPLRGAAIPLVFVPGDNEWLDCHRLLAGSFDPLERLRRLRELAYAQPPAAGVPAGLQWQRGADSSISTSETGSTWPEHQRWIAGPAMFTTLNVPGSRNGLSTQVAAQVHRRRATAVTRWLLESAELAARQHLPVLVVGFHATVALERLSADDLDADVIDSGRPYAWFRALLWRCVVRFPGTVLLLNGDAHSFRDGLPWQYGRYARRAAERFAVDDRVAEQRMRRTRWIQGFGSPHSRHWLQIEISAPDDAPPAIVASARHV